MKILELVTRAETTDELIRTLNLAADLCDQMGDNPLLFREFVTGIRKETVLATVQNKTDLEDFGPRSVKGGIGKQGQIAILEKLRIRYPVFTKMTPPGSTFGFHGDPHIFIPPPESRSVWSPEIEDLGGQRLARGQTIGLSTDPKTGVRTHTVGAMAELADKFAETYLEGLPDQEHRTHEVIFDCEKYYLLNIQLLLSKFAGYKNRLKLIAGPIKNQPNIDPRTWTETFKTYKDVAETLKTQGIGYVKWYQSKIENNPQAYTKPKMPSWRVTGERGSSVIVSAWNEEFAKNQALKSGGIGNYGVFPKGPDSIVKVEKL